MFNVKRRFVALVLAMLMVFSGMPLLALAAEVELEMDAEDEVALVTDVEIAFNVGTDYELVDEFIYGGIQGDESYSYIGITPLSPGQTPPPVTIPNRRLTPAELEEWIANYHARGGMSFFEEEVVRLVNVEREARGIAPLTLSPRIMMSARFKAQSMSDLRYFDHESPVYGHFTNISRELFNVTVNGENLAIFYMTPQAVVDGWMDSPGHRENILRPVFVDIGVGFFNGRWAQKFSAIGTSHLPVPVPVPTVTDVTVTPAMVNLIQGGSQSFTATVTGTNFPSQAVTWSVEGSTNPGTSISFDGVLTVAANEAASALTVRATSVVNSGVSGTANVGVVAAVTSWEGLRAAVNAAEPGVDTTIQIHSSFSATGQQITIPTGRHITLVSSNTAEGEANIRTLTQGNTNQRHFVVNGELTLCQNITLRGGSGAGGVRINGGGELIMNAGSLITNITNLWEHFTPVVLDGSNTTLSAPARLAMMGGAISNNTTRYSGGVDVGANSILVMRNNSEISYNTATFAPSSMHVAGGIRMLSESSVLEMHDTASVRNNSQSNTTSMGTAQRVGGILMINGSFTMYGGSIADNTALARTNGHGGIAVINGNFTMHDGVITNNKTENGSHLPSGGVVLIGHINSSFTMNGGSIIGNDRGGITLTAFALFTMNDGLISNNNGHGVDMRHGDMVMNGGLISNHIGSGVSLRNNSIFTMTDGEISNNKSSGVETRGAFTMSGGTIFNNEDAHGGGGIRQTGGTVNISEGVITGNTAPLGGGVYVWGTFTMTGGSITNNIAMLDGGGIYCTHASHLAIVPVTAFSNLNIGPDVIFHNNTAGNDPSAPPQNYHILTHIASRNATIWGHPLNNHDINYTGRLGQEPS